MLFRFSSLWIALGLLLAMWGLGSFRQTAGTGAPRPVGFPPGPVKILQFYASVGRLLPGEKALLCYGVENARTVRIAPALPNVYPAHSRCVEIVPQQTTHYTILAEGFDGRVATQSFTLPVVDVPRPRLRVNVAVVSFPGGQ